MYINRLIKSVIAFAFITAALSFAPFLTPDSSAQECFLEICKQAEGAGDTPFTINFDENGFITSVELFDGGDCFTYLFDTTSDLEVTESPTQGWILDFVDCEGSPEIEITSLPGGIDAVCNTTQEASRTCTFVNSPAVSNIPTLSEWGMIAAAAGLGLVGVFFAVRRRSKHKIA